MTCRMLRNLAGMATRKQGPGRARAPGPGGGPWTESGTVAQGLPVWEDRGSAPSHGGSPGSGSVSVTLSRPPPGSRTRTVKAMDSVTRIRDSNGPSR